MFHRTEFMILYKFFKSIVVDQDWVEANFFCPLNLEKWIRIRN
jgi:hypothetical protein